jgi:acyl transferase domain-containing protein
MARPFRPMAIVAATCLLPGAYDVDELWKQFEDEQTSIDRAPDDWLDRSLYYSPDPQAPNRTYSETVATLGPWEYSAPVRLPPKQAQQMDPAHRIALELGQRTARLLKDSWFPRERAGIWVANAAGTATSQLKVVGYHASELWARRAAAAEPGLRDAIEQYQRSFQQRYPHPREECAINGNILSGRIANYLDLHGPQMTVDANCAGSLAGLRNACLSLQEEACDLALVAGICTQQPEQMVVAAKARAIAGRPSFPFDRNASGYVPGEGGAMIAVVRAEDAERHGLRPLGLIRSIGVSVSGRTAPWSPSEAAERLAVTRAWADGEFDPAGPDGRIDYIEAHGTATPIGDQIEHATMMATYGQATDRPIPFGSIKSMIGHTVETAGLAGILRGLYVFDRQRIPPNVGVEQPAGFVTEHADRLRLAQHDEPLDPSDGLRRVAVNSFGVGGINYHAILESAPAVASSASKIVAAEKIEVRSSREPIAIVGLSAIMPGAPDAEAVWEHLRSGTAIRTPLEQYIPEFASFHAESVSERDRTVCPVSAIVEHPVLREPARWRILPKLAAGMFSDHILLLNAASQLVADGVVPTSPEVRRRSGVFVTDILDGDGRNTMLRMLIFQRWWTELRTLLESTHDEKALDALEERLRADAELALHDITENTSMAGQGVLGASRVASGLDLGGAAVAVNSACASGLAALGMAMQELRSGGLDFALVGGASLAVDVTNQVALSAIGSLTPTGFGRPYDKDANGFFIGTGAAWFALKRLSDAERDGDRIHAVLRECQGNSDGRGRSLLAPNVQGRRELIQDTYRRAGIDPHTVQYVEGHGAASELGDASEVEVLAEELATPGHPVSLGSIKGNYGHLKGPAALAGLLKVVLCLRHHTLVPTPGLVTPGALAGVDDGRVHLVDRCVEWPENGDAPRRAGVNAFGLGGTNFHAILEEYRPASESFSARSAAATPQELADQLSDGRAGDPAGDPTGAWRAALFARNERVARAQRGLLATELLAQPAAAGGVSQMGLWAGPEIRTGPVTMLFPGQAGTQYFDTVAWLATQLEPGPAVARQVEEVLGAPGRVIRQALSSGVLADLGEYAGRSGTSQVLGLVAANLVWLWVDERTGARQLALGHSAGEFAALVAAGCLSLPDAIHLSWERGRLAEAAIGGRAGLMAAVFADPDRTQQLVDAVPGAYLATVNGPRMCVVAGWAEAVQSVLSTAETLGLKVTPLDVTVPFHTPLLAEAGPHLRELLDQVSVAPPAVPTFSAVRDGLYPADPDGIREAITGLYVHPVRLDRLITRAAAAGSRRFVECGFGRSLSRAVETVLGDAPHLALAGPVGRMDRLADGLWVAGIDRPAKTEAETEAAADPPAEAEGFGLFTPVAVPAGPWPGEDWRGTSVTLVSTGDWPLTGSLATALESAGALVDRVGLAELTGASPGAKPAADLGGPQWLIWVSSPARREPSFNGLDGARTLAELACLRTVTAASAAGWAQSGTGGLLLVTAMDGRFGESRAGFDPTPGALAGFARALGHEHPEVSTAIVDVGPDLGPARAVERLVSLGRPAAGHHELGLTSNGHWTPELVPLQPFSPDQASLRTGLLDPLRDPGAAMIVSGGSTGIVSHLLLTEARARTDELPGRLVLLSRTPAAADGEPDPGPDGKKAELLNWRKSNPGRSLHDFERDWGRRMRALQARRTLAGLRQAGLRVDHEVLDVTDARGVRELGERLRLAGLAVRGLVHGAGVERSVRITEKPGAEWEETAAVKIIGFHDLVDAAGPDLRFVLAHGSLSGSLGLPGQTDYSAANEYLAKAVVRLTAERPGIVARYVGWPAWSEIGMAAGPEIRRRLEASGLRYLDPAEGARWAQAVVARADVLPAQLTVLPVPLPPPAAARAGTRTPPRERWWLVDTVHSEGDTDVVRRLYDSTDPRDGELADHQVRGNVRIPGVQLVEQLAEAFLATADGRPGRMELSEVEFRQGLVLATSGRRPSTVRVLRAPDGSAQLRIETVPLLRGDLPGPGPVLVATARARFVDADPPTGEGLPSVEVRDVRPLPEIPDAIELARIFGIEYGGRFALPVTGLRHPDFDAAGRFHTRPPERHGRTVTDPAALDLAIRTVSIAASDSHGDQGIPAAIERVVLDPDHPAGGDQHVFVTVRPDGGYDVLLTGEHGRPIALIGGLRLRPPADHSG